MFKKLKVQAVLGVVAGSLAIGAPSVSAETEIDLSDDSECLPWDRDEPDGEPSADLGHWLFWKSPGSSNPFESLSYTTTGEQFILAFTTLAGSEIYFGSYLWADPLCGTTETTEMSVPFVACLNLTNVGSDPATDYFTGYAAPGGMNQAIRTDDPRFIIWPNNFNNTYFEANDGATTDRSFTGLLTLTLLNGRDLDDLSNEYLCNWVGGDESVGGGKGCSGPYGNFCYYYEYLVQRVEESEGLPDTL
jgi:hypothetical protein